LLLTLGAGLEAQSLGWTGTIPAGTLECGAVERSSTSIQTYCYEPSATAGAPPTKLACNSLFDLTTGIVSYCDFCNGPQDFTVPNRPTCPASNLSCITWLFTWISSSEIDWQVTTCGGMYTQTFTNVMSLSILGTTHKLGVALIVELWDAAGNRITAPTNVNPTTGDVTITFTVAQSGRVVITGAGTPIQAGKLTGIYGAVCQRIGNKVNGVCMASAATWTLTGPPLTYDLTDPPSNGHFVNGRWVAPCPGSYECPIGGQHPQAALVACCLP